MEKDKLKNKINSLLPQTERSAFARTLIEVLNAIVSESLSSDDLIMKEMPFRITDYFEGTPIKFTKQEYNDFNSSNSEYIDKDGYRIYKKYIYHTSDPAGSNSKTIELNLSPYTDHDLGITGIPSNLVLLPNISYSGYYEDSYVYYNYYLCNCTMDELDIWVLIISTRNNVEGTNEFQSSINPVSNSGAMKQYVTPIPFRLSDSQLSSIYTIETKDTDIRSYLLYLDSRDS